jgi:hypothetical protein
MDGKCQSGMKLLLLVCACNQTVVSTLRYCAITLVMRSFVVVLLLLITAIPAQAGVKAAFIDGVYVFTGDGCDKLKSLQSGKTAPSVMTQPWTVTSDGIAFWEGSCSFSKVEKQGQKTWRVTAECEENGDLSKEIYVWRRTSKTTFSVRLANPNTSAKGRGAKTYTRCDVSLTDPALKP